MKNIENKILAFDYLTTTIIDQYREQHKIGSDKSYKEFSKLKLIKLLFLAVVASKKTDYPLFDIFDNFVAMPYGHVEIDVYEHINESKQYDYLRDGLALKDSVASISIDESIKKRIDKALDKLLAFNSMILDYSAFQLVEVSHKYNSWKLSYGIAKTLNKQIMPIPIDSIINEKQLYFK